MVLKSYHLYKIEELKKQIDLAYSDKTGKIPKEIYTRRVR